MRYYFIHILIILYYTHTHKHQRRWNWRNARAGRKHTHTIAHTYTHIHTHNRTHIPLWISLQASTLLYLSSQQDAGPEEMELEQHQAGQKHTHARTHIHTHNHSHIHARSHTQTHTQSHTQPRRISLRSSTLLYLSSQQGAGPEEMELEEHQGRPKAHARTHTHIHTHNRTHIHARSHTHTRTIAHTYTHNCTHIPLWISLRSSTLLCISSRQGEGAEEMEVEDSHGVRDAGASTSAQHHANKAPAAKAGLRSGLARTLYIPVYGVHIRCFWQGSHQIYGYIRCTYTVLLAGKSPKIRPYTAYIHGVFGREITRYTAMYGVYTRFWPTLLIFVCEMLSRLYGWRFFVRVRARVEIVYARAQKIYVRACAKKRTRVRIHFFLRAYTNALHAPVWRVGHNHACIHYLICTYGISSRLIFYVHGHIW